MLALIPSGIYLRITYRTPLCNLTGNSPPRSPSGIPLRKPLGTLPRICSEIYSCILLGIFLTITLMIGNYTEDFFRNSPKDFFRDSSMKCFRYSYMEFIKNFFKDSLRNSSKNSFRNSSKSSFRYYLMFSLRNSSKNYFKKLFSLKISPRFP